MRIRSRAVASESLHTGALVAAGTIFGMLVFEGDNRWAAAAALSAGPNGALPLPWDKGLARWGSACST